MILLRILLPLFLFGDSVFAKDNSSNGVKVSIPTELVELMTSSEVLLIGERHGTKEVPDLIFTLARSALERGESVSLGLEVLDEVSPVFFQFLNRDVEDKNTEKFLNHFWWNPKAQDGRRSKAMLSLLFNVKKLMKEYPDKINVYFYNVFSANYIEKEELMAANIYREVNRIKASVNIVLSGRIHTVTKGGLPYDVNAKSMGEHLLVKAPTTKSIVLTYSGGTTWSCYNNKCGIYSVLESPNTKQNLKKEFGALADDNLNHDFYWLIGNVKASPPASVKTTPQENY